MVISTAGSASSQFLAGVGQGFDGVVRISVAGFYGSGALLYGGRAVLTSAHLFSNGSTAASVRFETVQGTQTVSGSLGRAHPAYDSRNGDADLAIVWLGSAAPVLAQRYELYRSGREIGQSFTMVGYGQTGTGDSGVVANSGGGLRHKAENRFDADGSELKAAVGNGLGWSPGPGVQLMADFDNGKNSQDALGQLMGVRDPGLGAKEGLIAQGDSGGPAFIGNQLAGVASYVARLGDQTDPDIDGIQNSSYGEIAAWQRVGEFQRWIDQTLRAQYPNAPTRPAEVKTSVAEGGDGVSYAYFLVSFAGLRPAAPEIISVDYTTRDGTAKAGEDYLAVEGTLNLYADETEAVIAVEVLGDSLVEPDETFYLDITNPVGGSFGKGILTLTAIRTISNDDVLST